MQESRPGIFDNGDRPVDSANQRADGKLTDSGESAQLYSDVGERGQELVGGEPPVETDRLRRIETTQTDSDPTFLDETQPLIPDDAFYNMPAPKTPTPITGIAPALDTETSPYRGESDSAPFSEGGEIRGWSTGVGEQQGGAGTIETMPGSDTESLTD